jgi:hypothetical protein
VDQSRQLRRRRRRTPPDIVDFIQKKRIGGWTVSRILEAMQRDETFADRMPSERTIRYIAAEVAAQDKSGSWALAADRTGHPDLLLPALAAVMERSAGETRAITNAEAEWIVRLRSAAPALPPYEAWAMARRCIADETSGKPLADLEEWLAFELWTDAGRRRQTDLLRAWRDRLHANYGGNEQ